MEVDSTADRYCPSSLVNESEPSFHVPPCCTYTSVTTNGFRDLIAANHGDESNPVQADRGRSDEIFTDTSWMSACL